MSEQNEVMGNVEVNFADVFENSIVTLNTGDIVKGTVISITPTEIYVNLGAKSDGFIPLAELSDDPQIKPEDVLKVGDEIEVFVVRVNDVEGNVMLSKKKLDNIRGWQEIEQAFETGAILKGKVVEVVNGGIIVLTNGTKVFVPASQANDRFLSDLTVLLNKGVSLKIIDVNRRKRKIVGSIRVVLEEEKKIKFTEFWSSVEEGKMYKGTVKSLTTFGAFVDVGGVDGLVHISELSWSKLKHPSEVVSVGDEIDVIILDFDKENNKVSLGYKTAEENPWERAKNLYKVDDVVRCTIVRMMPFGAFAQLMPGIDGLVHISQISNKRIAKPSDILTIGDVVDAKIVEIDWDKQKISLSIRELLPDIELDEPIYIYGNEKGSDADNGSEEAENTEAVEAIESTESNDSI